MNSLTSNSKQHGVALVISLLFLLVVTIISVTAARNSSFSLKFSANVQDQNDSFQAAEAALFGTLARYNPDPNDPNEVIFRGEEALDPFAGVATLSTLNDPNAASAVLRVISLKNDTPPGPRTRRASSTDLYKYDIYRVDGLHDIPQRGRTRARFGIVKTRLP